VQRSLASEKAVEKQNRHPGGVDRQPEVPVLPNRAVERSSSS
jgi:hypothetical protein